MLATARIGYRAVALLGLAMCIALQLHGVLHHLLVQHEVCPEHGELAHASGVDHAQARASAAHGPTLDATPERGEATHEHCPAAVRDPARRQVHAVASVTPDPLPTLSGFRAATSLPTTVVLVRAPKTSPPA